MIPVFIVPCISRFDLLERLLRSIDHPVEVVVVVDNSDEGWRPPEDIGVRVEVLQPLTNVGYGGGINMAISQTPAAPFWVFANADVVLGSGDLAAMEAAVKQDGPRFVCANQTVNPYALSALNREMVGAVGLFDEWTFFPAYYEDNDHFRRMRLLGLDLDRLDLKAWHGHPDEESGSLTIKSSDRFRTRNDSTFVENRARYVEKWGGMPGEERYATPWDLPVPLDYVKVDLPGRARRAW